MPCRYYLASAADDSVVKLWDLRKLKNFKTIELESNYQVSNQLPLHVAFDCFAALWSFHSLMRLSLSLQVHSVTFDQTGTYLAIAGNDIQ